MITRLLARIQGWLYARRLGYHKTPEQLFKSLYNPDGPRGTRRARSLDSELARAEEAADNPDRTEAVRRAFEVVQRSRQQQTQAMLKRIKDGEGR